MDNSKQLEEFLSLVGLSTEEAREKFPGRAIRVRKLDGQDRRVTSDYRPSRINVEVEEGLITRVLGVG